MDFFSNLLRWIQEAAIKIGIISDSHDNVPKIKAAIVFFNEKGVEAVLHCGDFVAPFSFIPFEELECGSLYAVFGNNDGEKKGLSRIAESNGWRLEQGPMEIELGGRKIAIMHEPDRLRGLIEKGVYDVIASGHLHKPKIEKQNGALVINPGEAGGWTTGKATVAIVDLETMDAEICEI